MELGSGIYTVPDLALILQLPQAKVRRWLTDFYDERLADSNNSYSWKVGNGRGTNFLTLVEFYVFYLLRQQKITVAQILRAHKQIAKKLKTPYPFASSRLLVSGREILFEVTDDTWAHANQTNQIVIHKFIEEFARKIDFSSDSHAERLWPMGKDHAVVVDPHHQFGQPVIQGTNINASTIYSMHQSGEKLSTISILYDLTEKQVEDAIAFCKSKAA